MAATDTAVRDSWLTRRLQRNAELTPAEIACVNGFDYVTRGFEAGHYLLREGDRPTRCSFLLRGFVYRHKIVGNGGRQIVAIHLPGDFIDVQQMLLDHADHNVQALTAGTLLSVSTEELTDAARVCTGISLALSHQNLIEASILREWLTNTNRRDARSRMAHLLCELAMRSEAAGMGSRETFELPMTQEQLGDTLGLTAVHVNRTLKTLSAEGVIVRDKRSLGIADWSELCAIGDFSTGYLHLNDRID